MMPIIQIPCPRRAGCDDWPSFRSSCEELLIFPCYPYRFFEMEIEDSDPEIVGVSSPK
jgi:hypothetical protein